MQQVDGDNHFPHPFDETTSVLHETSKSWKMNFRHDRLALVSPDADVVDDKELIPG